MSCHVFHLDAVILVFQAMKMPFDMSLKKISLAPFQGNSAVVLVLFHYHLMQYSPVFNYLKLMGCHLKMYYIQFHVNFLKIFWSLRQCFPSVSNQRFNTVLKGGICIYLDVVRAAECGHPSGDGGTCVYVCVWGQLWLKTFCRSRSLFFPSSSSPTSHPAPRPSVLTRHSGAGALARAAEAGGGPGTVPQWPSRPGGEHEPVVGALRPEEERPEPHLI